MLKILTGRDDWARSLARIEKTSVYATYAYVSAMAALEPESTAEAAFFETGDGIVFHPYLRRPIVGERELTDLVSAFDFGGFWANSSEPDRSEDLTRDFGSQFENWCAEQGIVSEFVRIQPFTDSRFAALAGYELSHVSDNVVIDLETERDVRWSRYESELRRTIRRGVNRGQSCEQVDTLGNFMTVFEASLDNLEATDYYRISEQTLSDATDCWVVFELRTSAGELAAAHLYLADGDVLWAYQCHNNSNFLTERPSDCLYDCVIDWAKETGFKRLHMGGGSPSLLRYKKKFSESTVPYSVANKVIDQVRYDSLVNSRGSTADSGFFPAYRESSHRHSVAAAGQSRLNAI